MLDVVFLVVKKSPEFYHDSYIYDVDDNSTSTPIESFEVDHEGGRLLSLQESYSSFKKATNYPELLYLKVGAKIMFLNNSLIDHKISNGTCGVIPQVEENGDPHVAFPVRGGIEVNYYSPFSFHPTQ